MVDSARGTAPAAINGILLPHLVSTLSDQYPTKGSEIISTDLDMINAKDIKIGAIIGVNPEFSGGR